MTSRLAVVLILIAAPASAQTTNCQRDYWGNFTCTTQQPSAGNWAPLLNNFPDAGKAFREGFETARQRRLMEEQHRLLAEQHRMLEAQRQQTSPQGAALAEKAQEQRAAQMVASGECAAAEAYALDQGNIGLAAKVKDYCGK